MTPLDGDLVVIFGGIVAIVAVVQITRIIRARLDRSGASSAELQEIRERMNAIGNAVDSIAVEVERISEAQRFTTKLLSEREGDPARLKAPQ